MSEQSVTLFDRGFAVTIAFVLPGLVALFGIATVNPTVQTWFQGAQSGPTVVGFLFVLLAALALNLVITALRWFLFERVTITPLGCPWVPAAQSIDHARRRDVEAQYVDLRHQHYYHYLAYANTAVALPLAATIWCVGSVPRPAWSAAGFVWTLVIVSTVILSVAACDAVQRFDRKAGQLLEHPHRAA